MRIYLKIEDSRLSTKKTCKEWAEDSFLSDAKNTNPAETSDAHWVGLALLRNENKECEPGGRQSELSVL